MIFVIQSRDFLRTHLYRTKSVTFLGEFRGKVSGLGGVLCQFRSPIRPCTGPTHLSEFLCLG